MSTLQQKYKKKISGFADVTENRRTRVEKHEKLRRKQRSKAFNQNRNISSSVINKSENIVVQSGPEIQRSEKLMKWKAEREKQRLAELKKRPPFIVGKVHHKIYSPISDNETVLPKVRKQNVSKLSVSQPPVPPQKRISKATEKRLMNKAALAKQVENNVDKRLKSINKEQKSEKKVAQSFAPSDHKFKAPKGLAPVFGKVAVQSLSQESIKEAPDNKMNDTLTINKDKDADDLQDSSIESFALKVSFDETFTCSDENDNKDVKKTETQDNSVHDNDAAETLSSKNASTPKDSPNEPAFFSPYVVSSRGKSNARKEQQLRRGFSLNRSQSDDIPTKDTIMQALNISVEEEERTAQYFRFLLNKEVDGLNELCKKWTDIKEDDTITEDGQYQINQAIGQTKLLLSKKFERFRKLVADCETGKGEMLVTCKDLQGFWDMMYMEVKNCETRFERLEKLRSQNWIEEQSSVPRVKPVVKKKNVTKKKAVPNKVSSLRAFLAEKKKNVLQNAASDGSAGTSESINNRYSKNMHKTNQNDPNIQSKTRRSSVFKSSTPGKQKMTRSSLLPKSRLSVTSTSYKSPLTLMKVSQMSKTLDVQLDDTIPYINSNQTPGKGILKAAKSTSEIRSAVKSSKVNFDDNVVSKEVPVKGYKQKSDLSGVLDRINNFHFASPDEVVINAERKLTFDDSLDETENDTKENSELNSADRTFTDIPSINIETATPSNYPRLNSTNNTPSATKQLKRQNAFNGSDQNLILSVTLTRFDDTVIDANINTPKQRLENLSTPKSPITKEETSRHDETIRVLRNRIVTPMDTPKHRRSSKKVNVSVDVQDSEHKENKAPMKTRRKSSVKVTVEDTEKKDVQNSVDKTSSISEKRKSRRSVKFTETACTGCVDNKPPLPMTPHVRRSRAKSTEKKRATVTEDLITWETPETLPDRVRRSRSKKVDPPI